MTIKRYDFVQQDNWQGHPYPDSAYMEPSDDGEYVMFDDYEQALNEATVGASAFNVELDVANGQIAESAGCDFETNQWTFQMPEGFRAGAGKYMIIKLTHNINTTE